MYKFEIRSEAKVPYQGINRSRYPTHPHLIPETWKTKNTMQPPPPPKKKSYPLKLKAAVV